MSAANLFLFILLAVLAEILGTVGGFGSSVFFVPMASYFLDFQTVLGLTALFHLSSNLSKIGFFRKGIDKKLVLYLGIPAVLFVSLGAYLSQFANPRSLTILLGIFLVAFGLLFIINKNLKFQASNRNAMAGGVLSGFFAGLLGTGGAIRGATLSAFKLNKNNFIATSAIIDLGIDFSRSVVYVSQGYVGMKQLYLVPILIVVGFIGTYLGKRVLDQISQTQFKRFVLYLLIATGLLTLIVNI